MNTATGHDAPHLATILTPPRDVRAEAVASACRAAGLTFVNESEYWGKGELASWLRGPYAVASRHASGRARVGFESAPRSSSCLRIVDDIDADTLEEDMRDARAAVRRELEVLSDAEGAANFAFKMLASGMVERFEDSSGAIGWVPTQRAHRLRDRVLSLFAADYLARSADYELDFYICRLCRVVCFDAHGEVPAACRRHRISSEWHLQDRRPARRWTHPYIPEVA